MSVDNYVYRDHGMLGTVLIAKFAKREDALEYAKGKVSRVCPMIVSYIGTDVKYSMNTRLQGKNI